MHTVRRHVWLPVITLALLAATGCRSDSPSGPGSDTRRMAETFEAIADSLSDVGMDDYARPYAYVADLIRAAGGATPITLTVDGREQAYFAVGAQMQTMFWYCSAQGGGGGNDTTAEASRRHMTGSTVGDTSHTGGDSTVHDPYCEAVPHVQNMFFAWEPDSAWRLVRVMSDTGYSEVRSSWNDSIAVGLSGPIDDSKLQSAGAPDDTGSGSGGGVEPVYAPMLWAELMDSEGRFWWANEGSQTNRLLSEGSECPAEPRDTTRFDIWADIDCKRATFSYQHQLRFDPPPSWVMSPVAGGTDTVRYTMHPQTVIGVIVRFDTTGWFPPDTTPVDTVPPDTVIVDTVIVDTIPPVNDTLRLITYGYGDSTNTSSDTLNLRLIVTNQSRDTVTITFMSTQEFDFVVYDSVTNTKIWQWSDGKAFGEAMIQLRLAPGESKVYAAKWGYGSLSGRYLLEARLTSSNFPRKAHNSVFLY